ncbi:hypothetical protein IWQ60_001402 [Tieghemiomyces parasiticus]|uniref:Uncharacterized protein n=1 Tax=Tieghemiomyces parasiticus TaxID=78921 RepID=A0A9W8AJE9_9FUNG|nr:hypothetical protein IWQ60_001402 [Tieghemiomyces parasiticus]
MKRFINKLKKRRRNSEDQSSGEDEPEHPAAFKSFTSRSRRFRQGSWDFGRTTPPARLHEGDGDDATYPVVSANLDVLDLAGLGSRRLRPFSSAKLASGGGTYPRGPPSTQRPRQPYVQRSSATPPLVPRPPATDLPTTLSFLAGSGGLNQDSSDVFSAGSAELASFERHLYPNPAQPAAPQAPPTGDPLLSSHDLFDRWQGLLQEAARSAPLSTRTSFTTLGRPRAASTASPLVQPPVAYEEPTAAPSARLASPVEPPIAVFPPPPTAVAPGPDSGPWMQHSQEFTRTMPSPNTLSSPGAESLALRGTPTPQGAVRDLSPPPPAVRQSAADALFAHSVPYHVATVGPGPPRPPGRAPVPFQLDNRRLVKFAFEEARRRIVTEDGQTIVVPVQGDRPSDVTDENWERYGKHIRVPVMTPVMEEIPMRERYPLRHARELHRRLSQPSLDSSSATPNLLGELAEPGRKPRHPLDELYYAAAGSSDSSRSSRSPTLQPASGPREHPYVARRRSMAREVQQQVENVNFAPDAPIHTVPTSDEESRTQEPTPRPSQRHSDPPAWYTAVEIGRASPPLPQLNQPPQPSRQVGHTVPELTEAYDALATESSGARPLRLDPHDHYAYPPSVTAGSRPASPATERLQRARAASQSSLSRVSPYALPPPGTVPTLTQAFEAYHVESRAASPTRSLPDSRPASPYQRARSRLSFSSGSAAPLSATQAIIPMPPPLPIYPSLSSATGHTEAAYHGYPQPLAPPLPSYHGSPSTPPGLFPQPDSVGSAGSSTLFRKLSRYHQAPSVGEPVRIERAMPPQYAPSGESRPTTPGVAHMVHRAEHISTTPMMGPVDVPPPPALTPLPYPPAQPPSPVRQRTAELFAGPPHADQRSGYGELPGQVSPEPLPPPVRPSPEHQSPLTDSPLFETEYVADTHTPEGIHTPGQPSPQNASEHDVSKLFPSIASIPDVFRPPTGYVKPPPPRRPNVLGPVDEESLPSASPPTSSQAIAPHVPAIVVTEPQTPPFSQRPIGESASPLGTASVSQPVPLDDDTTAAVPPIPATPTGYASSSTMSPEVPPLSKPVPLEEDEITSLSLPAPLDEEEASMVPYAPKSPVRYEPRCSLPADVAQGFQPVPLDEEVTAPAPDISEAPAQFEPRYDSSLPFSEASYESETDNKGQPPSPVPESPGSSSEMQGTHPPFGETPSEADASMDRYRPPASALPHPHDQPYEVMSSFDGSLNETGRYAEELLPPDSRSLDYYEQSDHPVSSGVHSVGEVCLDKTEPPRRDAVAHFVAPVSNRSEYQSAEPSSQSSIQTQHLATPTPPYETPSPPTIYAPMEEVVVHEMEPSLTPPGIAQIPYSQSPGTQSEPRFMDTVGPTLLVDQSNLEVPVVHSPPPPLTEPAPAPPGPPHASGTSTPAAVPIQAPPPTPMTKPTDTKPRAEPRRPPILPPPPPPDVQAKAKQIPTIVIDSPPSKVGTVRRTGTRPTPASTNASIPAIIVQPATPSPKDAMPPATDPPSAAASHLSLNTSRLLNVPFPVESTDMSRRFETTTNTGPQVAPAAAVPPPLPPPPPASVIRKMTSPPAAQKELPPRPAEGIPTDHRVDEAVAVADESPPPEYYSAPNSDRITRMDFAAGELDAADPEASRPTLASFRTAEAPAEASRPTLASFRTAEAPGTASGSSSENVEPMSMPEPPSALASPSSFATVTSPPRPPPGSPQTVPASPQSAQRPPMTAAEIEAHAAARNGVHFSPLRSFTPSPPGTPFKSVTPSHELTPPYHPLSSQAPSTPFRVSSPGSSRPVDPSPLGRPVGQRVGSPSSPTSPRVSSPLRMAQPLPTVVPPRLPPYQGSQRVSVTGPGPPHVSSTYSGHDRPLPSTPGYLRRPRPFSPQGGSTSPRPSALSPPNLPTSPRPTSLASAPPPLPEGPSIDPSDEKAGALVGPIGASAMSPVSSDSGDSQVRPGWAGIMPIEVKHNPGSVVGPPTEEIMRGRRINIFRRTARRLWRTFKGEPQPPAHAPWAGPAPLTDAPTSSPDYHADLTDSVHNLYHEIGPHDHPLGTLGAGFTGHALRPPPATIVAPFTTDDAGADEEQRRRIEATQAAAALLASHPQPATLLGSPGRHGYQAPLISPPPLPEEPSPVKADQVSSRRRLFDGRRTDDINKLPWMQPHASPAPLSSSVASAATTHGGRSSRDSNETSPTPGLPAPALPRIKPPPGHPMFHSSRHTVTHGVPSTNGSGPGGSSYVSSLPSHNSLTPSGHSTAPDAAASSVDDEPSSPVPPPGPPSPVQTQSDTSMASQSSRPEPLPTQLEAAASSVDDSFASQGIVHAPPAPGGIWGLVRTLLGGKDASKAPASGSPQDSLHSYTRLDGAEDGGHGHGVGGGGGVPLDDSEHGLPNPVPLPPPSQAAGPTPLDTGSGEPPPPPVPPPPPGSMPFPEPEDGDNDDDRNHHGGDDYDEEEEYGSEGGAGIPLRTTHASSRPASAPSEPAGHSHVDISDAEVSPAMPPPSRSAIRPPTAFLRSNPSLEPRSRSSSEGNTGGYGSGGNDNNNGSGGGDPPGFHSRRHSDDSSVGAASTAFTDDPDCCSWWTPWRRKGDPRFQRQAEPLASDAVDAYLSRLPPVFFEPIPAPNLQHDSAADVSAQFPRPAAPADNTDFQKSTTEPELASDHQVVRAGTASSVHNTSLTSSYQSQGSEDREDPAMFPPFNLLPKGATGDLLHSNGGGSNGWGFTSSTRYATLGPLGVVTKAANQLHHFEVLRDFLQLIALYLAAMYDTTGSFLRFVLASIPAFVSLNWADNWGTPAVFLAVFGALALAALIAFRYASRRVPDANAEGLEVQTWDMASRRRWRTTNVVVIFVLTTLYLPLSKLALEAIVWSDAFWPVVNPYTDTDNPRLPPLGPASTYRNPLDFCYTTTMRQDQSNLAWLVLVVAIPCFCIIGGYFPWSIRRLALATRPAGTNYDADGTGRAGPAAVYKEALRHDESPYHGLYAMYRPESAGHQAVIMAQKFIYVALVVVVTKDNCLLRDASRHVVDLVRMSLVAGFGTLCLALHWRVQPYLAASQNAGEAISRVAQVLTGYFGLVTIVQASTRGPIGTTLFVVNILAGLAIVYLTLLQFGCFRRFVDRLRTRVHLTPAVVVPTADYPALFDLLTARVWQETWTGLLLTCREFRVPRDATVAFSESVFRPPYLVDFKGTVAERHLENLRLLRFLGRGGYHHHINAPSTPRLQHLRHTIVTYLVGPDMFYHPRHVETTTITTFFGKAYVVPFPFTLVFVYDEDPSLVLTLCEEADLVRYVELNAQPAIRSRKEIRMMLRCLDGQEVNRPFQRRYDRSAGFVPAGVRRTLSRRPFRPVAHRGDGHQGILQRSLSSSRLFNLPTGTAHPYRHLPDAAAAPTTGVAFIPHIRYRTGTLRIHRAFGSTWQGEYNMNAGFHVQIEYNAGEGFFAPGKTKTVNEACAVGAQRLGLDASYNLNPQLRAFLRANEALIRERYPQTVRLLELYRQTYRDAFRRKRETLSYDFYVRVFDAPRIPEDTLWHYLEHNEANPLLHNLRTHHATDIRFLIQRYRQAAHDPATLFWYLFWDDLYRLNARTVPAFATHACYFSPYYPTSIAFCPLPRKDLEAFLAQFGLWQSPGHAGFIHNGLLNRLYHRLRVIRRCWSQ